MFPEVTYSWRRIFGLRMEIVDFIYEIISEYVEGIAAFEVHMGIPAIWRNTLVVHRRELQDMKCLESLHTACELSTLLFGRLRSHFCAY
jgi:hypothetical protein